MTVFGMIHRQDYGSREKVLRCEIRSGDFCKHGALTVVGYEAGILKCQFLEGRSLQNFQTTLDDVYVNTLEMPYPQYVPGVSPLAHYGSYDEGAKWVALPWLYEQEGILQNAVRFENGSLVWDTTDVLPALSYQPYLIWVAKWVCDAIGYTYDFSQWEESSDRFLLMCNTLPASSMKNSFAQALPNWSVTEFFKQLEFLLCGEFEFDHHRERVDFTYTANVPGRDECVVIEDVADEFSGEVEYDDGKSEYKGLKNISYDGDDTDEWKSAQCTWLIEYMKGIPGYRGGRDRKRLPRHRVPQDAMVHREGERQGVRYGEDVPYKGDGQVYHLPCRTRWPEDVPESLFGHTGRDQQVQAAGVPRRGGGRRANQDYPFLEYRC